MLDKESIKLCLMKLIILLMFLMVVLGILFFINGINAVKKSFKGEYDISQNEYLIVLEEEYNVYNADSITPNDVKKMNNVK